MYFYYFFIVKSITTFYFLNSSAKISNIHCHAAFRQSASPPVYHHRHNMPVKPQNVCTMWEVAAEFVNVHRIIRLISHIAIVCQVFSPYFICWQNVLLTVCNLNKVVKDFSPCAPVALQHARMAQSPTRLSSGLLL